MSHQRSNKQRTFPHRRLEKEFLTITKMVTLYCKAHHETTLCDECRNFLTYAEKRLIHCPFGGEKPTCGNCSIHCYKKDMAEYAKKVMRYAGPRMIIHHPLMALQHIIDSKRPVPQIKKSKKAAEGGK